MSDGLSVRVVRPTEVSAYFAVRLALLKSDPLAYITTAEEWAGRRLADVGERLVVSEQHVTYGAYLAGELVGILTLSRGERAALRHRAEIVGVGVLKQARGQGCADGLMRAAITHTRRWGGIERVELSVTESQHAAIRLYERWGFHTWGIQPDAVQSQDGKSHALHHMSLKL